MIEKLKEDLHSKFVILRHGRRCKSITKIEHLIEDLMDDDCRIVHFIGTVKKIHGTPREYSSLEEDRQLMFYRERKELLAFDTFEEAELYCEIKRS